MPQIKCYHDGQRDIRSQEGRHREFSGEEDLESIGQCENYQEYQRKLRHIWLSRRFVRPLMEQAVVFERPSEA